MSRHPRDQLLAVSVPQTEVGDVPRSEDRMPSCCEQRMPAKDQTDRDLKFVRLHAIVSDLRVQPCRIARAVGGDAVGDLPHRREHSRRAGLHRPKLGEGLAGLVLGQEDLEEEHVFARREQLLAQLGPTCTLDRRPKQAPVFDARRLPEDLFGPCRRGSAIGIGLSVEPGQCQQTAGGTAGSDGILDDLTTVGGITSTVVRACCEPLTGRRRLQPSAGAPRRRLSTRTPKPPWHPPYTRRVAPHQRRPRPSPQWGPGLRAQQSPTWSEGQIRQAPRQRSKAHRSGPERGGLTPPTSPRTGTCATASRSRLSTGHRLTPEIVIGGVPSLLGVRSITIAVRGVHLPASSSPSTARPTTRSSAPPTTPAPECGSLKVHTESGV